MRRTHIGSWMLAAALVTLPAQGYQKKSGLAVELQAAMQRETVQGDLKGALKQYERILSRAGSDRETAARTLLRIGHCHEKLGSAEARKAYERLVREFGDQKDASEAKSRLAALGGVAEPLEDRVLYSSENMGNVRPSRNGRFAAFLCGRAICVIETASGAVKTAVPAPAGREARHWRPLVSPDGSLVVYTHFADEQKLNSGDLRISGTNTSGDRLLLAGSSETKDYLSAVDWSSDGKEILAAKTNTKGKGLFMISAGGGEARDLETQDFNWWTGRRISQISPDGRWIAYPSATPDQSTRGHVPTDVRIMPAQGGSSKLVLSGPGHDYPIGWLANGDLIVASDRSGKPRAYRLPMLGGSVQGEPQLLGTEIGEAANAENVLGVTPNGALFLLDDEYISDLFSFRSTDDPMRRLPLGFQGGRQVFSLDGSKLAYAVGGGGVNENSIVIRDMASGKERMLPGKIPSVLRLTWYPDGQSVLAICNTGNYGSRPTFRLHIVSGEIRPTADIVDMSSWHTPTILADNRTLLYTARMGDYSIRGQIAGLDLETGAVRPVIRPRAEGYSIGVFGVSPDRKRIVYVEGGQPTGKEYLMISSIENPEPKTLCESPKCLPRTPYFGAGEREIVFWSGNRPGEPKGLWRVPVEGGEPRLLRDVRWTLDGPAIHPTSGEIIVGVGEYKAQLTVKRLALPVARQ